MGVRGLRFALGTALCLAALLPATADGTVTVGSNLQRIPTGQFAGTDTLANTALAAGAAAPGGVTSPVNGTVTLWRVLTASAGNAGFQVVHPLGANLFASGGTTLSFPVPGNQVSTYAVQVPIKIGDYPAIVAESGLKVFAPTSGARAMEFQPALQDGAPGVMPVFEGPNSEITMNAEVTPTNTFGVTATTLDKAKGKATLTVDLPNPGEVAGTGKGAKVSSLARASKSVTAPGPVPLVIKATGKKAKKLNQTGKVKLSVTVTFTPTGGSAFSQTVKVKLKKKL